ncbi:MAG: methylmalonyl-CoA mutase, partial [Myxococcales bacterium]
MTFPAVTLADWRALVDKELAGKPFEKVLVHEALAGLAVQPLYTTAPAPLVVREPRREPFRVCPRQSPGVALASVVAEVDEGADALWLSLDEAPDGL